MNPIRTTTILVLTLIPALATRQAELASAPQSDPVLQDGFRRLLVAGDAEAQRTALEFLRLNGGARHERLVPQLLVFSEAARSTQEAMLCGFVLDQLAIPAEQVVDALVPLLEDATPARRASVAGVLSGYEDLSIERGADFSLYRPILEREPPPGLVRHLFATDPDAALLALLRAQVRTPQEERPLLWAWHELADLRWKLRHGFLAREDLARSAPDAVASLGVLAAHPRWWARLAAARMALEESSLHASARLVDLTHDVHPLVRETALTAQDSR